MGLHVKVVLQAVRLVVTVSVVIHAKQGLLHKARYVYVLLDKWLTMELVIVSLFWKLIIQTLDCIANCQSCSDITTCDTCDTGFIQSGSVCVCPSGSRLNINTCESKFNFPVDC